MSEQAGSVLAAGNPAAGQPPAAGGEGAPAAVGGEGWVSTLPESVRGVVLNKGWKGPEDAIQSYTNLEKLLGADKAGRAIVPPKDDAPAEEWGAFWGKLGRPETPEGYQIETPEGMPQEFAQAAAQKFHELGIPAKQAQALVAFNNEFVAKQIEAQEAAADQQAILDVQDLQKEWGTNYDANAELARRAAREAGLSAEEGKTLERALGVKRAAQMMAKLGQQFAEAAFKGEDGGSPRVSTPEQAKARLDMLRADPAWVTRYISGDVNARTESERLHRIAFPDPAS
jgi:hypothetical protein